MAATLRHGDRVQHRPRDAALGKSQRLDGMEDAHKRIVAWGTDLGRSIPLPRR